jgi:hypothetical protein
MPVEGYGLVEFALSLEHRAEIHVVRGAGAMDRNGLADESGGGLKISCLICDHAEEMQAVRMAGIDGKNLLIKLLGFREPSLLMMLKSSIHHVLQVLGLLSQDAILLLG